MVILGIVNLLVEVCLNCVCTLDQDIASISVELKVHSSFCFVVETKHHSSGILNSRGPIGEHTRRHINERNGELA